MDEWFFYKVYEASYVAALRIKELFIGRYFKTMSNKFYSATMHFSSRRSALYFVYMFLQANMIEIKKVDFYMFLIFVCGS